MHVCLCLRLCLHLCLCGARRVLRVGLQGVSVRGHPPRKGKAGAESGGRQREGGGGEPRGADGGVRGRAVVGVAHAPFEEFGARRAVADGDQLIDLMDVRCEQRPVKYK